MARAGVILQLHIKPGGTAQAADRGRAAGKDARLFNAGKRFGRAFNDGERGSRSGIAFVPVFQADKHAGDVLPVAARAGADGREDRNNVIFLFGEEVLLNVLNHLQRLLLGGSARELHRGDEHPPVFLRQERGGKMQEQPHHAAQQHNVNHHPAQAAV